MPSCPRRRTADQFTFGLWTVGWQARDPFGDATRPAARPGRDRAPARRARRLRRDLPRRRPDPVRQRRRRPATEHIARFRKALDETGLVVPMVTTNLFTHPVFKDGGFTSNDRDVRRYALRKVMRNIDLAAELGAHDLRALGRPRGRRVRRGQGRPGRARPLPRGHGHARRSTSSTRATASGSRSSPSRTSRAATSCCRPSGTRSPSSPRWSTTSMVGLNPEVGPRADGRAQLRARHRAGAVARQAVPHRPQRPARHQVRPGPGLRPRRPAQRVLPGRPARVRRPGRRPAYDGPRHFDYKPSRTEDIAGVWASAAANMRTYLLLKERAAAFRADPEVQAALAASRVAELARADAGRRARPAPTCSPTASAFEDFDVEAAAGARLRLRARSTSSPSSTCSAPGRRRSGARRRGRLVHPVVQGGHPRRRDRRAGPERARAATPTAPRSTRTPGGPRSPARSSDGRRSRRRGRARRRRPSSTAWSASTTTGAVVRPALLWNDTRSAGAAADLVAELGGRRAAWAGRAVGSVPVASFTVTKLRWLAEHEPATAARTAAVCLPHDWLTWRLRAASADIGDAHAPTAATPAAPATGRPATGDVPARPARPRRSAAVPVLPAVLGPARRRRGRRPGRRRGSGPGPGDNAAAALGVGAEPGRRGRLDRHLRHGVRVVGDARAPTPTGTVAGFADATGRFLPLVCTLNAARVLDAAAAHARRRPRRAGRARAVGAGRAPTGWCSCPTWRASARRTGRAPPARCTACAWPTRPPAHLARAASRACSARWPTGSTRCSPRAPRCGRVILIGGGARSEAVRPIAPAIFGVPVAGAAAGRVRRRRRGPAGRLGCPRRRRTSPVDRRRREAIRGRPDPGGPRARTRQPAIWCSTVRPSAAPHKFFGGGPARRCRPRSVSSEQTWSLTARLFGGDRSCRPDRRWGEPSSAFPLREVLSRTRPRGADSDRAG